MTARVWLCVAGAAIVLGTLSAAQHPASDPEPAMVKNMVKKSAAQRPDQSDRPDQLNRPDRAIYLLTGTGLVAIGGIVLVGGVVGLGGLRIPGGVAMTVARTRRWTRTVRTPGAHRAESSRTGRRLRR